MENYREPQHLNIENAETVEQYLKQADDFEIEAERFLSQFKEEQEQPASGIGDIKEKAKIQILKGLATGLVESSRFLAEILCEVGHTDRAANILLMVEDIIHGMESHSEVFDNTEKLRTSFVSVVEKHIDALDQDSLSPHNQIRVLTLFDRARRHGSDDGRFIAKQKIEEKMYKLAATLTSETEEVNNLDDIAEILQVLFYNRQSGSEALEIILQAVIKFQNKLSSEGLASLLASEPQAVQNIGLGILINRVEKVGLDGREILEWWWAGERRGGDRGKFFSANLDILEKLEERNPGAAKFLHDEFGIRDFGRYPIEVLSSMYETRDEVDKPFGLLIYPKDDHNGTFGLDQKVIAGLFKQLTDLDHILRVIECDGKRALARRLIKSSKRYGEASFAVIGGHGTEDSIQFGGEYLDEHTLSQKDLMGEGVGRSHKFFVKNPSIILVSCSTGQEGGIGQKLSERFNAEVIAPDLPTDIKDIRVSKGPDNRLGFKVKFYKKESHRVFASGVQVEN